MEKIRFTIVLGVALVLALLDTCNGVKVDLTVGQQDAGDVELESTDVTIRGLVNSPISYTRTFTGDNESVVTQVKVERLKDERSALVALVHGGPGQTFATLNFMIWPTNDNVAYKVTLYGQRRSA